MSSLARAELSRRWLIPSLPHRATAGGVGRTSQPGRGKQSFSGRFSRVEGIAKGLPTWACSVSRAKGLGLVPCRAQRALCSLRDGFANADRWVLAFKQHAKKVPGVRVILQHKRLREQPFRKVKDRRCMVAPSVSGAGVAPLRGGLLVHGLPRACVRGEPMFFAKKFCHCWRAADFAFAFAHHFYLPPALPRHFAPRLPGFAFKQRWFLHQRINSYNVVTWPLTAGSHWGFFWIGGRRRNLHSFFIRLGARDFYCRDCRVDLFDRQSEHDQHFSRDPDNSD